jgi:hypothetical protein
VRLPLASLEKVVGAVWSAFQKRIVYQQPICWISKQARLPLAVSQKLLVQLREICHPIGLKDFNSLVLRRLQQIQKLLALNDQ